MILRNGCFGEKLKRPTKAELKLSQAQCFTYRMHSTTRNTYPKRPT